MHVLTPRTRQACIFSSKINVFQICFQVQRRVSRQAKFGFREITH